MRRAIAGSTGLLLAGALLGGILLVRGHDRGAGRLDRLVPSNGVASISYGSFYLPPSSGANERRVALVSTPDHATGASDLDWTWIEFEPAPLLGGDGDADVSPSHTADGLSTLGMPTDSGGTITIVSARFRPTKLNSELNELTSAGSDVDAIASIVSAWSDDTDLVWSGRPLEVDTVVRNSAAPVGSAPGSQMVGWIDRSDKRRFAASFRPYIDENSIGRAAIFGTTPVVGLTDEFLSIPASPTPSKVSESKWFSIISELVAIRPEVHLSGGFLAPEPLDDITDMARGAVAAVIGDSVTLRFDLLYDGTPTSMVTVKARMSKREVQLWADLINSRDT